ncbi:NUDIX hydrolase [Euzebya rosea]|uniref:NUDIX hydrolase n=1 Tax=Euzebya rosea TaxID=2052804 RepID=UPI000D3E951D|nr:NUDIX domain-containing protein [Euzebya rosea]
MPAGPPPPVVGVGAVVVHDGRLLVVQRGNEPARGSWTLPGGRLEPGETIDAGVLRELEEETGLRGRVVALCGVAHRMGPTHNFVILDYRVDVADISTLRAGDDAAAVRFVTRSALEALPTVPGTVAFLDDQGLLDELTG